MPDINLHSFCGPEFNECLLDWRERSLVPGPEISDTVKCSAGLSDFRAEFGLVVGGREDCLDVNNRCDGVQVHAKLWEPRGKYLATLKGGARNIEVTGTVRGHGSEVDIDIGNVSDQSLRPTRDVVLNLKHENGEPISVRVINGSTPHFVNAFEQEYHVTRIWPPFGFLFCLGVRVLRMLNLA